MGAVTAAVVTGLAVASSAYGAYRAKKAADDQKDAGDLKREADRKAELERLRAAGTDEQKKTNFTSELGLGGMGFGEPLQGRGGNTVAKTDLKKSFGA